MNPDAFVADGIVAADLQALADDFGEAFETGERCLAPFAAVEDRLFVNDLQCDRCAMESAESLFTTTISAITHKFQSLEAEMAGILNFHRTCLDRGGVAALDAINYGQSGLSEVELKLQELIAAMAAAREDATEISSAAENNDIKEMCRAHAGKFDRDLGRSAFHASFPPRKTDILSFQDTDPLRPYRRELVLGHDIRFEKDGDSRQIWRLGSVSGDRFRRSQWFIWGRSWNMPPTKSPTRASGGTRGRRCANWDGGSCTTRARRPSAAT